MSASLTGMVDPALVLNAPGTGVCPDANLILGPAVCRTAGAPLKVFKSMGLHNLENSCPALCLPGLRCSAAAEALASCLYPAIACICGIWCGCGPVCCRICYSQISVEVLVEKGIFPLLQRATFFSLFCSMTSAFSAYFYLLSIHHAGDTRSA